MVDGQAADLLGRHIADGAEYEPELGLRRRGFERARGPNNGRSVDELR